MKELGIDTSVKHYSIPTTPNRHPKSPPPTHSATQTPCEHCLSSGPLGVLLRLLELAGPAHRRRAVSPALHADHPLRVEAAFPPRQLAGQVLQERRVAPQD
eukprot:13577896-Alexandrium_andersonii.AAC.1